MIGAGGIRKAVLAVRADADERTQDPRPMSSLWDLLFEFKRLSLKELGMSGREVKAASRTGLAKLPEVKEALGEAEGQIVAYRAALERSRGDTLKLRSYAVVALDFERLVVRASRPAS